MKFATRPVAFKRSVASSPKIAKSHIYPFDLFVFVSFLLLAICVFYDGSFDGFSCPEE